MDLPSDFSTQMQSRLGKAGWAAFLTALEESPPVSLRYNAGKFNGELFPADPIPWSRYGRYLPARPSFTLDPHFHAGRYYVQEAGSMFLSYLLAELQRERSFTTALDLCAAPGGKTTLLLDELPAGSLVVANEVIKSRYERLRENLAKWGHPNVISTQGDPRQFVPLAGQFDLVLVDAPCSGEGLFRKTPEATTEWSPQHVQHCELRQRRILHEAHPLLAESGILIYSTCTYNTRENDQNVSWLCREGDLRVLQISVPDDWGLTPTAHGYQFYPHRTRSEGFYVAVLEKTGTQTTQQPGTLRYFTRAGRSERARVEPWLEDATDCELLSAPKGDLFALPTFAREMLAHLSHSLRRITPGTPIGQIKGRDLVPTHELAVSTILAADIPRLEVDREQALRFLRKEPLAPPANSVKGWHLLSYAGYGLGWVKVLPNRVNNYFPNALRIRMQG